MRDIAPFDPHAQLSAEWPGWRVRLAALHGLGEVIDSAGRLILLDADRDTWDLAVAHALAHLQLGHHLVDRGAFTAQEEADAAGLACLWLDCWAAA